MQYVMSDLFGPRKKKTLYGRVLSTLLGTLVCLSQLACQPSVQPNLGPKNISQRAPTELPRAKGFFVQARIRRIDVRTGLISLETAAGTFLVIAEEDDLTTLHEGDEVTVYLVTDNAPVTAI